MDAIHNARVTLLATALNNLGVASIGAGVFAPLVTGSVAGAAHILAWVAFGADLMAMGTRGAREA